MSVQDSRSPRQVQSVVFVLVTALLRGYQG
jgi:hypothetical protein